MFSVLVCSQSISGTTWFSANITTVSRGLNMRCFNMFKYVCFHFWYSTTVKTLPLTVISFLHLWPNEFVQICREIIYFNEIYTIILMSILMPISTISFMLSSHMHCKGIPCWTNCITFWTHKAWTFNMLWLNVVFGAGGSVRREPTLGAMPQIVLILVHEALDQHI